MKKLVVIFCLFCFVFSFGQVPTAPNLSNYKTTDKKLSAWAVYCDQFLVIEDNNGLSKAAKKGLAMTPEKYHWHKSLFYFYIGVSFDFTKQNDSVVKYLELSEKQARLNKQYLYHKRVEETLMQLLIAYAQPDQLQKRRMVLDELQNRADTVKDLERKSNLHSSISGYYVNLGEYEKGMHYRLENIKAKRRYLHKGNHDDSINFGVALVNVGELYLQMENPEKAAQYLEESQGFIKDYQVGVATIYKDLIEVSLQQQKLDDGLKNYQKLKEYLATGVDNYCWAVFLDTNLSFADYHLKQNNESLALKYLNHANELSEKYGDVNQIGAINQMFGRVYLRNKNYQKALEFLKKAEVVASEDSPISYSILHKSLSETYAALGNYKMAYDHFAIYSGVQDTLLTEKAKVNLAKMEAQFQNNKKQQEIKSLSTQNRLSSLEIENANRQKWFYILGLVSLFVIGGLIFWQSLNRKKTADKLQLLNTELDQANKTKTRFFSILNHDLRSPVSNLISFLYLQKESPELLDAESKARMENKTISSAENLLESMEDLLLWSKGQMENFKPMPKNIAMDLIFEDLKRHFSDIGNVNLVFENPETMSLFTDENYLKTILRNLISNAVKALDETENATVILSAKNQKGKSMLTVSDNGPGGTIEQFKALYDEKEIVGIKTGLGLHLIRDLAKAIDCRISVDTNVGEGTVFTLSFP